MNRAPLFSLPKGRRWEERLVPRNIRAVLGRRDTGSAGPIDVRTAPSAWCDGNQSGHRIARRSEAKQRSAEGRAPGRKSNRPRIFFQPPRQRAGPEGAAGPNLPARERP